MFELLSLNLYEHLKDHNFRGLPLDAIRKIILQMLRSLEFLKRHHIIHCDLKPENVLLKNCDDSEVKIIDFGSSCFAQERVYTYIQSRFYRAPEVMLGIPYTAAIDMWSLGCIAVELWTGFPLFPGEFEGEQFNMIMEVCGAPPKELVEAGCRSHVFFDLRGLPILVPGAKGRIRFPGTKSLQSKLRTNDTKFVDFIRECLEWDPRKRMTPQAALGHPWVLNGHQVSAQKRKDRSLEQRQQEVINQIGTIYQKMFKERNSLVPRQDKDLTHCRAKPSAKNLVDKHRTNEASQLKQSASKVCLQDLSQKLNMRKDASHKKLNKRLLKFNGNVTCDQMTGISKLIEQPKKWVAETRKAVQVRDKMVNINVNPIILQIPTTVPSVKNRDAHKLGSRKLSNVVQQSFFIKLRRESLRKDVNITTVEQTPKRMQKRVSFKDPSVVS